MCPCLLLFLAQRPLPGHVGYEAREGLKRAEQTVLVPYGCVLNCEESSACRRRLIATSQRRAKSGGFALRRVLNEAAQLERCIDLSERAGAAPLPEEGAGPGSAVM